MKSTEFLAEATPGMDDINVPKALAAKIAKEYDIEHDKTPEPLKNAPSKAEAQNNLVIYVKNDGSAYAIHQKKDSYWHFWTYKNGEVEYESKKNIGDVKKAIGARKGNGKWYVVDGGWSGIDYRGDKPASDVDSVKDRKEVGLGYADRKKSDEYANIYDYMDRVFLPKIQKQLIGYANKIYDSLKDMPYDYDDRGDQGINRNFNVSIGEKAVRVANTIRKIAKQGFSKETMSEFLNTYSKESHGYGSFYRNEEELARLIKEEPAARAKLAKTLLRMGKEGYEEIQEIQMKIMKDKLAGKQNESQELSEESILDNDELYMQIVDMVGDQYPDAGNIDALGLDDQGRINIKTIDGSTFKYDPTTNLLSSDLDEELNDIKKLSGLDEGQPVGFANIELYADAEDFGENTYPTIWADNTSGGFSSISEEDYQKMLKYILSRIESVGKGNGPIAWGSSIEPSVDKRLVRDLANTVFNGWQLAPIKDNRGIDTYTLFRRSHR